MITTHAKLVQKEEIKDLHFPKESVLLDNEHRDQLKRKIKRALALGNNEHVKCRILFKDNEGLKVVDTTVWAFGEDHVVLKSNTTVPMRRILDIEMP